MIQLLLIDDEEKIYRSVKLYLENKNEPDPFAFLNESDEDQPSTEAELDYQVHWASSGEEGLELFKKRGSFDLALIDMNMPPGWDGLQTIQQIRMINSTMPIALVTANISTSEEVSQALKKHRARLFNKPYGQDGLRALVKEMIEG